MPRELVVLGTASQAPTRDRNHNGYLLRWDELGLLFDPGEGTQRQMLLAGARSSSVSHILITHEHADHCLGLPGVLRRMALDQRRVPLVLAHPEAATPVIDSLLTVCGPLPYDVERVRLPAAGGELATGDATIVAAPLDHRVPAIGYRLEEPDHPAVDPAALEREGLSGPIVGRLVREGVVVIDGRQVRHEDVGYIRPGQTAAFVMDTRPCAGAHRLLAGADLAVVEATFRRGDEALAERYGHLTADQAGRLAVAAGVRRLVLTHYSQRYSDASGFADEAGRHHPDVIAATDLARVPVPSRHAARARR